jgi:phytoene synthase
MTQDIAPQAPLTRLLCAYARPEDAAAARLVWALDERLADLVRSTSQPMIGQMRIAWWDEALGDDSGAKGRGDPLVDALRATGVARRPGLPAMLDGWEALLGDGIDSASLRTFADGRGGGLFRAVADEHEGPPWLAASGRLWALWDLARHLGPDDPMRAAALDLAREALPGIVAARWPRRWKMLRLATGLARHDVARGLSPSGRLTPRLYLRLVRLATLGG